MALTTGTQTNTQQLVLDKESLQALMADLQHLQENVLPKLAGIHGSILDYLAGGAPLAESVLGAPTEKAAGLAREAVQGAAAQRGLSPRATSALDEYLSAQTPALLSPLATAARGVASDVTSLPDPRLAQFLRPITVSSTSTEPSVLATTTDVLKGLGGIASAFV